MINVSNEIGKLEKVLLHRPGKELLNITPDKLSDLLFDDIPYLDIAIKEHDNFKDVLVNNGIEVVYLEDLMASVLDDDIVRDEFIRQYILEAGIYTKKYQDLIYDYLNRIKNNKSLVLKSMEGINLKEVNAGLKHSLIDLISLDSKMIIEPMPNLYFTRDPFASIGKGVSIHKMYSSVRSRETIYADYIFKYHPEYKDISHYYSRNDYFSIEGGDILNLNKHTLAIGISQRTSADAIELLAERLFKESEIDTVLAFYIPNSRSFMHLDTIFTQVDHKTFCVHPNILDKLSIFKITKDDIKKMDSSLKDILKEVLKVDDIKLIMCGGNDHITSAREQWSDASNTLCIEPGVLVCYERNEITNKILEANGLKVIKIASSELSRGRGGPRCMSMPLVRKEIS